MSAIINFGRRKKHLKNEVSCDIVAVGNKKLVAAARGSACIQIEHTNTFFKQYYYFF